MIQNDATSALPSTIVLGAGPAGLTLAYALSRHGAPVTVLEADPEYVGGISRTVRHKGFLFDIGGHRFFSKSAEVNALWDELLPHDMLDRPRSSRIYYRGNFFSYPLKPMDALSKLGVIESVRCMLSYALAKLSPTPAGNFEEWVVNQFGRRLFEIFFKTYTEKVWGMPCTEISADWAAQRIKGLSLASAVRNALFPPKSDQPADKVVKTLISTFRYPRKGPGMMWEAAADKTRAQGGKVLMGHRVAGVTRLPDGGYEVAARTADGGEVTLRADHVVSSMPLRELLHGLSPAPSCLAAADRLRYRDFLTVALILKDRGVFDDNWIYIHDPSVKVGRVQNFKSWSPELVPDPALNCYGLEYFCFEGDETWNAPDEELVRLATRELATLGLAAEEDVVEGCVVRQKKAYPVYDATYASAVEEIRGCLSAYPGLHLVGRNGMHRYNNQDHAMMTAMLTAQNILAGRDLYDVWQVNQDAEYHEAGRAGSESGTFSRPGA